MVAVVSWLPSSSGPNLLPPESLSFLTTLFTYDNPFLELLGGIWWYGSWTSWLPEGALTSARSHLRRMRLLQCHAFSCSCSLCAACTEKTLLRLNAPASADLTLFAWPWCHPIFSWPGLSLVPCLACRKVSFSAPGLTSSTSQSPALSPVVSAGKAGSTWAPRPEVWAQPENRMESCSTGREAGVSQSPLQDSLLTPRLLLQSVRGPAPQSNWEGISVDLFCDIKYQSITHHTEVSIFHISVSEMRLSMRKNSNFLCCISSYTKKFKLQERLLYPSLCIN